MEQSKEQDKDKTKSIEEKQNNLVKQSELEKPNEKKEVKETRSEQKSQDEKHNREILNFFVKKGFLVDGGLLDFILRVDNNVFLEELFNKIVQVSKTRIITKDIIVSYFGDIEIMLIGQEDKKKLLVDCLFEGKVENLPIKEKQKKEGEQQEESRIKEKAPEKKQFGFRIHEYSMPKYKKILVGDFIDYFRSRYNFLKDILKTREELTNLISINKAIGSRDFSIIGLVSNKRVTKNKNVLIELEDTTGRITALASQNKPEVFEKTKEIQLDDVIALRCSGNRDIVFVNDIFFPDAKITKKARLDEESYALFTSDIHFGSNNFLEKNFSKFIDWLNGVECSEEQKEKIKKIKYLFLVGDNIDGVGVFPGQEELLKIKGIREQYAKLAEYLKKIPKHITIFMCPGQHDSVRVPEPQPAIDEEFAEPLTNIENLFLVSNPAFVEIGCEPKKTGIKVLMYHGASLHNWISEVEELRVKNAHNNPARAVKYLLKHRHLSPTHSTTTYVPDERADNLIVKDVPDIMTTGEVHRTDIDNYNGILIICNSCWQSITPYEEKVGNLPDPCKVPMLNLKTREIKILDFS